MLVNLLMGHKLRGCENGRNKQNWKNSYYSSIALIKLAANLSILSRQHIGPAFVFYDGQFLSGNFSEFYLAWFNITTVDKCIQACFCRWFLYFIR